MIARCFGGLVVAASLLSMPPAPQSGAAGLRVDLVSARAEVAALAKRVVALEDAVKLLVARSAPGEIGEIRDHHARLAALELLAKANEARFPVVFALDGEIVGTIR